MADAYRFDVAISFAGENDRNFVRRIAELLRHDLGDKRVFFDEWFEAEIAGPDAHVVLQTIFGQEAWLVVAGISARYNEKPWTYEEWRAIQVFERRLRDAGTDNVKRLRFLPLRFGDGKVDGLFETAIVPDVRKRSPEDVAKLILTRLALSRQTKPDECKAARDDESAVRVRRLIDLLQRLELLESWRSNPWVVAIFFSVLCIAPFISSVMSGYSNLIGIILSPLIGLLVFRAQSKECKKDRDETMESLRTEYPGQIEEWGIHALYSAAVIRAKILEEHAKLLKQEYTGYGVVGFPTVYFTWRRPEPSSYPIAVKTWAASLGAGFGGGVLCALSVCLTWLFPVLKPAVFLSVCFCLISLLYATNVHFDEWRQAPADRPYSLKKCFLFGARQGIELARFFLLSALIFGAIGGIYVGWQIVVNR